MFNVYYYPNAEAVRTTLHSPVNKSAKILSGSLKEALNQVTTVDFSIGVTHPLYNQIVPFKGIVQITERNTGREVFWGRILKPKGAMGNSGLFTQSFIAEDALSFLNDSTSVYQRFAYQNEKTWLEELVYYHNQQVEPYKQFVVGTVDVEDVEAPNFHYWGQESSFDELKKRRDKVGGYITVSRQDDKWRIDWTKEIGKFVDEPIQLGKNIKSSSRTNQFENMITRIVPLGYESGIPWSDSDAVTSRTTIESVNDGKVYIDDVELVNQYGIIQRPVIFDDIRDPKKLLDAGFNYMDYQHNFLTSWEVDVVDLSLVDPSKQPFVVGNTHPVNNPPIASVENQQIVEKTTNILSPQAPQIRLGSIERSISSYWNQMELNMKALKNAMPQKEEATMMTANEEEKNGL